MFEISCVAFAIRTVGQNEAAARYAGIHVKKVIVLVMCLSGALGGMIAVNDIQGVHHRLLVGFTGGVGFVGIAVALMGRNHPLGVAIAALLFGFLYQGGAELGLWTTIPIELRIVIQGLVILFTGALDGMMRMVVARIFGMVRGRA